MLKSLLRFLGILILFVGLSILGISISVFFDPEIKLSDSLLVLFMDIPIIALGGYFMYRSIKIGEKEKTIQTAANIITSYRRIKLNELARLLKVKEEQLNEILAQAIGKGLVKGYVDRSSGEFFTEESMNQKVDYKFCPFCGAALESTFLSGETIKCARCDQLLS